MSPHYKYQPMLNTRALRAYRENGFFVTRKSHGALDDEMTLQVWDYCLKEVLLFCVIHRPRRFCTVEIDWRSPCDIELGLPDQKTISDSAKLFLSYSAAEKKSKRVEVTARDCTVYGLEIEQAEAFCRWVWQYFGSPRPQSGTTFPPHFGGEPA